MRRAMSACPIRSLIAASLLSVSLLGGLLVAGCDCQGPIPVPVDGSLDGGQDGGGGDSGPVVDGGNVPTEAGVCSQTLARVCGEICCEPEELCGDNDVCCSRTALCGRNCCGEGEICEGAVCHLDCGFENRCLGEAGEEVCCASDEVCINSRCFAPTTSCVEFIDCQDGYYCERGTGQCLPQPAGEECVVVPEGGEVVPTLLWHWDGSEAVLPAFNQVMMTPLVVNLNDDNGDGLIDTSDIPDVVFTSYCDSTYTGPGPTCSYDFSVRHAILRAVDGATGESLWDATDYRLFGGGQLAAGDIDNDGLVEIVGCRVGLGDEMIAFENDGTFKWRTRGGGTFNCGASAPSIADLDADGRPEVFVRYSVANGEDGTTAWTRACEGTGGWADTRNDHSPCDYTTAADLDGDGQLELVGGNIAYRANGSVYYDRTPGCGAGCASMNDGYPAIGDLDLDGDPEIIVMQSAFTEVSGGFYCGDHYLRILDHMGNDLLSMPIDVNFDLAPIEDETRPCVAVAGGGPPTIANFDDDPEPEIALAGAYGYVVLDQDGSRLWSAVTDDRSSRKTGSSVFDFDGDGRAEVVYADQNWMRVYNGQDGEVQFCICNTTATLWEYPVIADVDNDGHAEIVLASNDSEAGFGSCGDHTWLGPCEQSRLRAGDNLGTHGVRVFASPGRDWVATRRIWNQHTYHVTNVSETGQIPRVEIPNWSRSTLNNFRQNVQPGAQNITDLVPIDLSVDLRDCPTLLTLYFRVENQGWAASPPDVPVTIYIRGIEETEWVRVGQITTTESLLPSASEPLSFTYDFADREPGAHIVFRVVVNDPSDTPTESLLECRPANNEDTIEANCGFFG